MTITDQELQRNKDLKLIINNQYWSCSLRNLCVSRDPWLKMYSPYDASWTCTREEETPKVPKIFRNETLYKCLNVTTNNLETDCWISKEEFSCNDMTITDQELQRNKDLKLIINNQYWSCSLRNLCVSRNPWLKMYSPYDASWACAREDISATKVGKEEYLENCIRKKTGARSINLGVTKTPTVASCPVPKKEFLCSYPNDQKDEIIKVNQNVVILTNNQKWICSLSDMCLKKGFFFSHRFDASWECVLVTKDLKLQHSLEDCLWSKNDLKKERCVVNQIPSDCSVLSVNDGTWKCSPWICGNGPMAKIRPGYDCIRSTRIGSESTDQRATSE
jgi:hypothetical protein